MAEFTSNAGTRRTLFPRMKLSLYVPCIVFGIVALLLQGLVFGVSPTRAHAASLNAIHDREPAAR